MNVDPRLDALLALWFPADLDSPSELEEKISLWFGGGAALDETLRREFGDLPDAVAASENAAWAGNPRRAAAAVVALDQIPRNVHRGTPRAFAYDARAVELASVLVDRGVDDELHPVLATFLYLPFEHAEDRAAQARSVAG